jgi:hypothetical protein
MNSSTGHALLPSKDGRSGSAADRLLRISKMTRAEFLAGFERVNVLANGSWHRQSAKAAGQELRDKLARRHITVLVLGRGAWRALGLPGATPFFGSVELGKARLTLLPHPSGRNLLLNGRRVRTRVAGMILAGAKGSD